MGGGMSCLHSAEDDALEINRNRAETAARLIDKTGQDWCLRPESLDFFYRLWSKNESVCLGLFAQLKSLCHAEGRALALKAAHVDTIISSYNKCQQLSENIPSRLGAYLARFSLDAQSNRCLSIQDIIQNLRIQHAPALTAQANNHHLKHHTVYHALEIKVRTMHVLTQQLALLTADDDKSIFLREIASFLIEFHDHEQKVRGQYDSVEQATADRATTWIASAFNFPQRAPHFIPLIALMADWIIVLGTTMVWGAASTMDLSELYFLFDDAITKAGMPTAHASNQPLIDLLGVIALVTGVCDKNPASFAPLMETESLEINVLACLQRDAGEPSILQRFLCPTDHSFPLYFQHASKRAERQAWLTTWVPHLNMRAEIAVSDAAVTTDAINLIELISICQQKRALGIDNKALRTWLLQTNKQQQIQTMMESLFFLDRVKESEINGIKKQTLVSGLCGEINFSKSQSDSLRFVYKQVPRLLFLLDGRNAEHTNTALGIDATVPLTDAACMQRLKDFYFNCTADEKIQLTQELFFVSVLQIGSHYAALPELSYQGKTGLDTKMITATEVSEATECISYSTASISSLGVKKGSSFFPAAPQKRELIPIRRKEPDFLIANHS